MANTQRRAGLGCLAAFVAVAGLITASAAVHVVPAGHGAIVFNQLTGVRPVSLGEGMNLVVPFVERPRNYEVRTRTYVFSGMRIQEGDASSDAMNAKTSDAQTVLLDVTVRYHLDPEQLHRLHDEVGPTYEEKIIRPQSEDAARGVVAAYKAEEVFSTKRQELEDRIEDALRDAFLRSYIELDEVLLRNVTFSEAYHEKIEQKQIAQQRAQRKGYELAKEKKEKERKLIEARAQAIAIRIKGNALASYPSVVEYDYVQSIPDGVETYVVTGDTIVNLSDLFGAKTE